MIKNRSRVIETNNQILISYYLKDGYFEKEEIDKLKEMVDEQYWFQNYYIILYSGNLQVDLESSIVKYLIPKRAKNEKQKNSYMNFYKENILSELPVIRDIPYVLDEIKYYLALKIEESEGDFENEYMDI
ncbi:hypothetical protein ACQKOD_24655 [Bacillus mycoides]|uniref:hypothetical protein n=1 Tax=Bacillus mycoides TaxID=1405 RepID=UPI003D083344